MMIEYDIDYNMIVSELQRKDIQLGRVINRTCFRPDWDERDEKMGQLKVNRVSFR